MISGIPSPTLFEFARYDFLSFPLEPSHALLVYKGRVVGAGKEQRAQTKRGEHHASELPL